MLEKSWLFWIDAEEMDGAKAAAAIHHRMGCFRLERGAAHQALEALRQALMAARLVLSDFSVDELADWLERNRPDSMETTVVHGDYRLGNVLFASESPARRWW